MVQIIQSGPSTATLRQQALDQSLQGAIQGFGNYQKQEADKALTQRQQALQVQDMTIKLKGAGYDVTPEQVAQSLAAPKEQGFWDKLTGAEAPAQQAPIDLYSKRTPEYIQKQENEKQKAYFDQQVKQADLGYKQAQTNDLVTQSPFKSQKMQADIQKVQSDIALSPITKRRMLAEIQKSEAEVANLPFQREKLIAETQKAQREGNPGAGAKLSKMSGETQGKVGSIASGLKALQGIDQSINNGVSAKYLDANTPIVGSLISDNSFTQNQRVLDEVIGRLQSGGAIGTEEIKTFRSLGPRPGDKAEVQRQKIQDQKSFLLNKLTAFGMNEDDLSQLGFDTGSTQAKQTQNSVASHPQVNQAMEWAKSNPNDPRAKEIMARVQ